MMMNDDEAMMMVDWPNFCTHNVKQELRTPEFIYLQKESRLTNNNKDIDVVVVMILGNPWL
jgi:hypothetical protein